MIKESKNDFILQEDLEIIAASGMSLEKLENKNILVTGATGLVGSQLVRALACCNRVRNLKLSIYLLVRDRNKAKNIFGELLEREDINIIVGDVIKPYNEYIDANQKIDYIIHAASITTSKMMVSYPVDVIHTALNGTENMLNLSVAKNCKGFLYISSMEVYGKFETDNGQSCLVNEKNIGYIDPLAVRSDYPESKRMCENMCIAYKTQYNVPVVIARLSQTFGAGILPEENRVFAQFARSVINRTDIVLHTKGNSEGNYCYLRETIEALLLLLINGNSGEAYNISNDQCHTTISNMAEMVCKKLANNEIKVVYDIPKENLYGYAAPTKMKLDNTKMKKLGWIPKVGLEEAYYRMIESMKQGNS